MIPDQDRHRISPQLRHAGFSLLEMAVVLAVVSVLLWVVAARFFDLQADAEKVAVEQVVGSLQSALGMKVAELEVHGDRRRLAALERSNPMDQLAQVPRTYLGVLRRPDPARIQGGYWYFDGSARALVYQVRNPERVTGGLAGPARIRWTVLLRYEDQNRNGVYDPGVERIEGVQLVPLEPYRWKR